MIALISKYRQPLMGMSILMVLWSHAYRLSAVHEGRIMYAVENFFKFGFYTETFLILSGFGLFYSLHKSFDVRGFYQKRVTRLLVPYALMALPFMLILWANGIIDWLTLCGRITTLSYWVEGNFFGMWYVALSVVLYLLCPVLYRFIMLPSKRWAQVVAALFVIVTIVAVTTGITARYPAYHSVIKFALDKSPYFGVGLLLGLLFQIEKEHPNRSVLRETLTLAALTAVFFVVNHFTGSAKLCYSICYKVLFCALLGWLLDWQRPNVLHRILTWLGTYTLELYILHLMLFWTIEAVFPIEPYRPIVVLSCITLALAICKPVHDGIQLLLSTNNTVTK